MQRSEIRDKFGQAGFPGFHFIPSGLRVLAPPDDPRSTGKALAGPQPGAYWRYRVGDYRIICDIQDGSLCVLVIEVGNRRDIYR